MLRRKDGFTAATSEDGQRNNRSGRPSTTDRRRSNFRRSHHAPSYPSFPSLSWCAHRLIIPLPAHERYEKVRHFHRAVGPPHKGCSPCTMPPRSEHGNVSRPPPPGSLPHPTHTFLPVVHYAYCHPALRRCRRVLLLSSSCASAATSPGTLPFAISAVGRAQVAPQTSSAAPYPLIPLSLPPPSHRALHPLTPTHCPFLSFVVCSSFVVPAVPFFRRRPSRCPARMP